MPTITQMKDYLLNGRMRGQVDFIYLLVFFFAVAIVLAIVIVIWSSLTSSVPFEALMQATPTGKIAQANATTSINILANALVFIFIFACIASMIAASFANSAPAFAVIGIIAMPIELIFAFIFHDEFLTLVSQSVFAPVVTAAPSLITAFQYLPLISLVVSVLLIVVVFIKP